MKHLKITSHQYEYLLAGFRSWLAVLGYAETTIYSMPHSVREFLHYQEQKGQTHLTISSNEEMHTYYYEKLKKRINLRYGGSLSSSYLNKHIQALQKFCTYLRQSKQIAIPKLHLPQEEPEESIKEILTQEEIKELYKAADNYPSNHGRLPEWVYEVLALRDKAMLTIIYGCGLRKNEAVHLDISDIQMDKEYIHVRQGKNYKERLVPLNKKGIEQLQNYIYESRPRLLRKRKEDALFISYRGERIDGNSFLLRLKLLIQRTNNNSLQTKAITLHSLRHSIATHLLQNGMKIESIAQFLGHSSLESTQIYTHLVEQDQALCGS